MSEQAPERPTTTRAPARAPAKRDNVFTRKIGPLPMWVWLVLGIALIAAYVYYRNSKANAAAAQPATTTAGAGQVPQFVNQTFTTVQPPVVPPPPPPHKSCPKGYAWDPDENKCVPEHKVQKGRGHHKGHPHHRGREAPIPIDYQPGQGREPSAMSAAPGGGPQGVPTTGA